MQDRPTSKNGVLPLAPSNKHSSENRPLFDDVGYCHGFVERVDFEPAHTLNDGCKIEDGYCWRFICRGTLKPYIARYWTGVRWTRGSKLLALWNGLRLCVDDLRVESAQGLPVVFKLERRNDAYNVVTGLTSLDLERNASMVLVQCGSAS